MLCGCSIVSAIPSAIVSTIGPSEEALSIGWVVEPFAVAFEQTCALRHVDKLVFEFFA